MRRVFGVPTTHRDVRDLFRVAYHCALHNFHRLAVFPQHQPSVANDRVLFEADGAQLRLIVGVAEVHPD